MANTEILRKTKRLRIIIITTILIFVVPLAALFIFLIFAQHASGINTIYTKNFNIETWDSDQVSYKIPRQKIRSILGEPLAVDEDTRCDFYSKPRFKWLASKEYKVCYDTDQMFFLKLEFEYTKLPFIDEGY